MVDRKKIKNEVMNDIMSFAGSGGSLDRKRQAQELFWKYRKEGLDPKESWKKAKKILS